MPITRQPDRLIVPAPAKINLFLHVGAKRADGFHDLESLVVFAEAGDELVVERDAALSLSVTGRFAAGLSDGTDNLVMKAARLLGARAGVTQGARMTLRKELPVASGIGGGSADAAAALRGLSALWGLDLPEESLLAIAGELGSDVPMCLGSRHAWVAGRGERIARAPSLPEFRLLLVNPMVPISTAEVFRLLDGSHPPLEHGYAKASPDLAHYPPKLERRRIEGGSKLSLSGSEKRISGRGKSPNSADSPSPNLSPRSRAYPNSTLPQSAFAEATADKAHSPAKPWRSRAQGEGVDRENFADLTSLVDFLKSTTNDLEPPARGIAPIVGVVVNEIARQKRVLLARMSGSGATCFGIFADDAAAQIAAASLASKHPDWWVLATALTSHSSASSRN